MVGTLRLRSKVGPKGQAVIPKPVRDAAGIVPGDEVYFRVEKGRIILEKKSGRAILDEFLNAVPKKTREPGHIDWDERYRGRFARRRP